MDGVSGIMQERVMPVSPRPIIQPAFGFWRGIYEDIKARSRFVHTFAWFEREWAGVKAGIKLFSAFAFILVAGSAWSGYKIKEFIDLGTPTKTASLPENPNEWPALTSVQMDAWVKALEMKKIESMTVFWGQSVEANRFYRSLGEVGKRLNVRVVPGSGNAEGKQIDILTLKSTATGPVLLGLFKEYAGSYPVFLNESDRTDSNSKNVDIFIGEK